jgi:hypothetical protein
LHFSSTLFNSLSFYMSRSGLYFLFCFLAMLAAIAETAAQTCTCTFTSGSGMTGVTGNWNTITWVKSGTCGTNTLPGPSDCVTIRASDNITLNSGNVTILGLNLAGAGGGGAQLTVTGSNTRLNIGPSGDPMPAPTNNIYLISGNSTTLRVIDAAIVEVNGSWRSTNNGNTSAVGGTSGFFSVLGCGSVGGGATIGGGIGANPNCNLNSPLALAGQVLDVQVHDMSGRKVEHFVWKKTDAVNRDNLQIPLLHTLRPGTYLLQVQTETLLFTKKVVVW